MVERTLADEIISIVHSEANNNPLPVKCTIHETYSNGLIDVLLENGDVVTYLPVIGSPRVGDTGVLLYLDDETNNQIIITNGGSSGGGSTNVSWGNILNKPSTFPPSAHKHHLSDIEDWEEIDRAKGQAPNALIAVGLCAALVVDFFKAAVGHCLQIVPELAMSDDCALEQVKQPVAVAVHRQPERLRLGCPHNQVVGVRGEVQEQEVPQHAGGCLAASGRSLRHIQRMPERGEDEILLLFTQHGRPPAASSRR